MKKRYKQQYYAYHEDCLVVCPSCGKDATVKSKYSCHEKAVLECLHCNLRKKKEDLEFYKAIVKLNCPSCGHFIHHKQGGLKLKPETLPVNCEACNAAFEIKPKTEKYVMNYATKENGLIRDSVFGCSFYFQEDFKGKLFWARNMEHLLEMENYISSELRTRLPYKMRMVERLPTFIKEAKNRDAILKILQKWKNSYK
ncbi:hypothetical protein A4C53_RS19515 [Elizabethkingia anophelis]|uniref:Replication restart DNA helicase PriA n=1 Tax=Elizabethkingia anophelis TaxID=1117645 RepID=A0AAE4NYK1_9FLAO|nr:MULTISPECIES: hypothetical protein [Elizabethkingia]AMR43255.1 hypothetical protein A2T74_12505 [Elizabethkingia anophelis]AMX49892.1 hypothetical protein A4C56_12505 [Elizabethkingia anophelis]AMX53284.1 hypothetical protein A2T72_12505 [Elizabethkingia anophelis]AMX56747.1 hypothetical protein A2T59_12505 [Elizabethkingia anophelis]EGT4347920.1 hypothetical protein [Elizabethkingia anophelis]